MLMSRKFRTVALSICVALMAGCATAPGVRTIENSRTYPMSYDQTWQDVVAVFAQNNIQIKNIAKDSGVIYAEGGNFDDTMADCGSPGLLIVSGRHVNFNVFVRSLGVSTQVSVNTNFTENLRFGNNFATMSTMRCTSYGRIETFILNSIGR